MDYKTAALVRIDKRLSVAQEQTDNTAYNVIKHLPVPYKIVDYEAKINSVIRHGLIYNGKVILKSIVTIEE